MGLRGLGGLPNVGAGLLYGLPVALWPSWSPQIVALKPLRLPRPGGLPMMATGPLQGVLITSDPLVLANFYDFRSSYKSSHQDINKDISVTICSTDFHNISNLRP